MSHIPLSTLKNPNHLSKTVKRCSQNHFQSLGYRRCANCMGDQHSVSRLSRYAVMLDSRQHPVSPPHPSQGRQLNTPKRRTIIQERNRANIILSIPILRARLHHMIIRGQAESSCGMEARKASRARAQKPQGRMGRGTNDTRD